MSKKIKIPHIRGEEKIYEFECVDLAKTFPEWRSPLLSADYMFIQTYRELNSVQKKLDEKEKEIEFYCTEMSNKWRKLKKKQENFLNDVENFNKFFVENECKRQRIGEKLRLEEKFQTKCKQDIFNAQKRIEYLEQFENDLKQSVNFLKPFNDYINNITNQTENFNEVGEMINYYVLLSSETKLPETFIHNLLGSEQLHNDLLRNLKTNMNCLIAQKNKLFDVKQDFHCRNNNLNKSQEKLKQKEYFVNRISVENTSMKKACDNIFQKLSKWKKTNLSIQLDDEKKLMFIENSINELQNAVQIAYKLNYNDNISHKADCSFITEKRMI